MNPQKAVLDLIVENTHAFFTPDFIEEINKAFGLNWKPVNYHANPKDPKGLTLDDGAKQAMGICALNAAQSLCQSLGVRYTVHMGRGYQVRACIEALRAAGYGKD